MTGWYVFLLLFFFFFFFFHFCASANFVLLPNHTVYHLEVTVNVKKKRCLITNLCHSPSSSIVSTAVDCLLPQICHIF